MDKKEKNIAFGFLDDGELVEMVYRPESKDTRLVTWKNGEAKFWEKIELDNIILSPYRALSDFISKKVILLPSCIKEYKSEISLINEVREFIHKYLDVSETFEIIASYYVLLSHLYDKLPNILYLRFIGDFGSGKSRALKVVGSLCYRPMMATGAISTSVFFRIIDKFKGTLILDEADFSNSDAYSEIIKILNSGYEEGKVVLRSEGDNKNNWDIKPFDVYCPKVIATRFSYKDLALESRCLTEVMAKTKMREDIPLNLPADFEKEALNIRNKLLCYRFKNYKNTFSFDARLDKEIEPRLRQITNIMLSIIKEEGARTLINDFIVGYNKQLINDRLLGFDGKIVQAIYNLKDSEPLTVGMIAEEYNSISEGEKILSAGSVGRILKNRLQIVTEHSRDGQVISPGNKERLEILFTKYGLCVKDVKDVKDVVGVSEEKIITNSENPFN